jgi:GT2 family glycosyltransferase
MSESVRTAVVIPVFNGLTELKHCVAALAWARDDGETCVIVVDSGSTDGTLAFLAEDAPWITVLSAGREAWWTAAVERGCLHVRDELGADRICLLNHDCRWSHDDYLRLSRCLDAHLDDIVCSRVVDLRDGSLIFGGGRQRRDGSLTSRLTAGCPPAASDGSTIVQWCGGMGVLFSIETYSRIGGFDAGTFPHYFGDSDFCLRGRRAGIKTRYCPQSLVYNDGATTGVGIPRGGASLRDLWVSLSSRRSLWNLRDNLRFYARHCGLLAPLALGRVYAEWAGIAAIRLLRGARA